MYMFNGIITSLSAARRSVGGYKNVYPLLGLYELGNVMVSLPYNDDLEAAVGGHITFMQAYTPTIKAMEERAHPTNVPYWSWVCE